VIVNLIFINLLYTPYNITTNHEFIIPGCDINIKYYFRRLVFICIRIYRSLSVRVYTTGTIRYRIS